MIAITMDRDRFENVGFGRATAAPARIERNALLFGTLVGLGTTGLVADGVGQFVVATLTTAAVAGGLYLGLAVVASRCATVDSHGRMTAEHRSAADRSERLAADGAGDHE